MDMRTKWIVRALAAVAALGSTAAPALGQAGWLDGTRETRLGIEVLKPEPDGDGELTLLSAALITTLRTPLGETGAVLVVDLPLAYGKVDVPDGSGFRSEGETVVGNPYLGVEGSFGPSNVYGRIGGRLPLTPEDKPVASFVGFSSDLDRWEAFLPDQVAVDVLIGYRGQRPSGFIFGVRGGPTLLIPTESGPDTEVFALLNGRVGYVGDGYGVTGGIGSRVLLSQPGLSFADRSFHQLSAGAWLEGSPVRPGLRIRLPLDEDLSDVTDFVLGVGAEVTL